MLLRFVLNRFRQQKEEREKEIKKPSQRMVCSSRKQVHMAKLCNFLKQKCSAVWLECCSINKHFNKKTPKEKLNNII